MSLDVLGEVTGRFVSSCAVLLQRLHHDPVQLAAQQAAQMASVDATVLRDRAAVGRLERADPRARPRRLLFANDPPHFV